MKRLLVDGDTSVWGGCFEEEFARVSRKFFEEIKRGKFILAISATTLRELRGAPAEVRQILLELPEKNVLTIPLSREILELRDAYVEAGVVGASSRLDAEHIACASVAKADLIVSWNFKHIVHYEKIRGYHAVNLRHGYPPIPIFSPWEVVEDEEERL